MMTAKQKRYCELMDRAAIRAEVLSMGIGETIKRGPDEKGIRVILDIAATELLPAIQEQDRYFNLAYPDRLIARTRKNPKRRKTAKKSADKKGKQK
jgi:hypothetical protein